MEKEYTLEDIANANTSQFGSRELDNGNPYAWAKAKPMEFTQDVEEMGKNFTITIDQVKNYLAPREAGTMENIGSGLVQVGSQLLEASAGIDLFFKKNSFPDLNDKEAQDLIALATHNLESIKANRAEMLNREGIGGFAFQASNVIGQAALSAAIGVATGGAAVPIALGGVQEFGRKTGDYAIKYAQETGDYSLKDQSAKDDLIALAYAGVSAAIEAGMGAERVLNGLIAKGSLKQAGKAALGEATEEFLQEYAEYAADSVAGYNERGELEVFKDALTGAVYGALGGGVMGFGMYYANKGKLTELFTRQGFDPATAKSMAVEAIDDAKKTTIAELITRDQLEKHYGQKYEDLKVKIDTVINNVQGLSFLTPEQRTNYVETVASDLSRQVMIQAAMFKTDTDSILNLSDIEAIGNQLVLNTPDMHDQVVLRQRIADKKAQLKELRSIKTQKKAQKLGVEGETEQESRLNLQIQALQNQIKRLDEEDLIENKIVSRRNGGVDVVGQAIDAGKNFIASAEAPTQQGLEGWLSDTPRTYRKWFARNTIPESVRANLLSNATQIKDVAKIHPDIKTDIQNALKRIANGLTMDNFAEMMAAPTRDANPFQSASFAYLLLSDPDVSLSAIASYSERLQAQQSYKDGAMQTPDDIMSQVIKENTPDKWNTDGTTEDKNLLMLYNQKTMQSKASTIAAIRGGDVNYITDILQQNGIKTREMSGTQIKDIARLNWQWFIGKDVSVSAGRNAQRIALNAIEQNVVSGNMFLLRNGYTQAQIDAMDDATWDRLVRAAYRSENPETASQEDQIDFDAIPDDILNQTDLAAENARLDAENPVYKGETINIDGKERSVYNSNGERIAQSEPALRNFYKWFGDSKVVDEQGRPLVVYHGTDAKFDTFAKSEAGIYFTIDRTYAESEGSRIISTYMKINKPFEALYDEETITFDEMKAQGYDGMFITDMGYYIAFEPTQIKSVNNRGTFDITTPNIYYQGAGKHLAGFDPETKAIILSKSMNTGSLPHEMAHFWLQEMFNRMQTEDVPESARTSWNELSRVLGITPDQRTLTADQQEKFANLTEAYIFNKTALPAGTEPVIKDYMEYVPERYNSFLDMGWVDGNGVVQNPILNEDSKRWFDAYYSGMGLFGDSPTMTKFAVSNEPAKEDVRTERQEILDDAHKEVMKTRQDAEKAIDENVPIETKQKIVDKIQDYDAAAKDFLAPAENADDINDKKRSVWQKTLDILHAGRGTDTREETMARVNDWVKKHWDEALAIATLNPNYYDNPTEIPTSLLIRAVSEQNTDPAIKDLLRANFAMAKSLEMKTGGLNNDTHDSMFLIGLGKIQNNLNQAYALKRFGATKNATARVDSEIAKFCERYASDVMSGRKSWQDVMALAATEFGKVDGIDSQVLSQTQLPKNASRQDFIKYMKHLIKVQAGAEMSGEQIAKFNEVATAAQIASTDLDSESESVYLAASAALRRYHDFVAESIVADNWFDKVAGQYFNRAMLSGLTTQTKNLVGNKFENWIVRAAIATKYGKSKVSTETITKERNRLTKIYESSLLSIPQMENLSDPTLVHGEGYGLSNNSVNIAGIRLQTLGKTSIPDPLAMLGRSDFYFRREVYLASLAARATQYATENNLDPDVVFKEFKKLSTTNETAGDARKEAILLGHTAVFTQNGSLAQALNKVRRVLNEMIPLGRRYGLGNLIAPFTKTPSNIVEMGARAIVSPFTSIYEYATTKELSLQHRVDLGNLAGALLLFAVTAALSGDYEPPYKVGEKYDAKRHYDSLRIGGVWIKLDSFGAMETPLRLLLGAISSAKGAWPRVVAGTFAQIPVDISKLEYALTKPAKGGTSFLEGELDKFIPTIASDAAKALGHQSGIVLDSPYLMGNKTIRKLGLDGAEPSVNDWIRLVGFGIIQIDNKQ